MREGGRERESSLTVSGLINVIKSTDKYPSIPFSLQATPTLCAADIN